MSTLPEGYEMDRSVLGTYRWRFEVNGRQPPGQAANWSQEECRQAAWDHWCRNGNASSRACPKPLGMQ